MTQMNNEPEMKQAFSNMQNFLGEMMQDETIQK